MSHTITSRVVDRAGRKKGKPVEQRRRPSAVVEPLISREEELQLMRAEVALQEEVVAQARKRQEMRRKLTSDITGKIAGLRVAMQRVAEAKGSGGGEAEAILAFLKQAAPRQAWPAADAPAEQEASDEYDDDFEDFSPEELSEGGDSITTTTTLRVCPTVTPQLEQEVLRLLGSCCTVRLEAEGEEGMRALCALQASPRVVVLSIATSVQPRNGGALLTVVVAAED